MKTLALIAFILLGTAATASAQSCNISNCSPNNDVPGNGIKADPGWGFIWCQCNGYHYQREEETQYYTGSNCTQSGNGATSCNCTTRRDARKDGPNSTDQVYITTAPYQWCGYDCNYIEGAQCS
jgi:hypothetical protein